MWLHTNGDIEKVAVCKVKPYELIDAENLNNSNDSINQNKNKKVVMLEDGLNDVEDQISKDDETIQYVMDMWEEKKDCVGAQYLKVINHMSFSDYAIYTVELPVSKHGTPEVKQAKQTEVENLMDYDVFE